MTPDLSAWLQLAGTGMVIGTFVVGAVWRVVAAHMGRLNEFIEEQEKRAEAAAASVDRLWQKHTQHDSRITVIESRLPALPTSGAVSELSVEMARVGGDLRAVTARMDAVTSTLERALDRIDRHEEALSRK